MLARAAKGGRDKAFFDRLGQTACRGRAGLGARGRPGCANRAMTQEAPSGSGGPQPGKVVLSSRYLWKIYGAEPTRELCGPIERELEPEACRAFVQKGRAAGKIVACCNVSFDVHAGEIFVIMGLSGSGKSTVVRCLSRLIEPTSGQVVFAGQNLLKLSERELIELRRPQ